MQPDRFCPVKKVSGGYHEKTRSYGSSIGFRLFYYACGGGSGGNTSTGTVSLYLTDDMGDFKQVLITLDKVQLLHTGSGTACDLLSEPETLDLANLAGVLQLLDISECPVQPYNRVRLEFAKAVGLMDQNGDPGECLFESYKDKVNPNQPNVLNCLDGDCTLSSNGGINVIADTINPFALDFDLKNFEVADFGQPECRVTLRVEPQNSNDIDDKMAAGYKKSTTGYVSDLDIDADSFTLTTKKGAVFPVDYAQALYQGASQPDLDGLLQFAADHGLRVRVMTTGIDIAGGSAIVAATIYVKLEGRVGGLDDLNHLFVLTNTAKGIAITVDYSDAAGHGRVEGNLADDSWVETKLFGSASDTYLAHEVEVEDENADDTDD